MLTLYILVTILCSVYLYQKLSIKNPDCICKNDKQFCVMSSYDTDKASRDSNCILHERICKLLNNDYKHESAISIVKELDRINRIVYSYAVMWHNGMQTVQKQKGINNYLNYASRRLFALYGHLLRNKLERDELCDTIDEVYGRVKDLQHAISLYGQERFS